MVVTDAERKSEYTPAQIKAIKKHVNAFAHQIARQMELFMAVGAPVAPKPAKNAQPEEAVDEKLEQQARESSAAVKAQCADLLELRRRVPEFIRRVMAQAFRVRAEVVKHSFAEPEHGMAGLPAREDIAQADANLKSLVAHMVSSAAPARRPARGSHPCARRPRSSSCCPRRCGPRRVCAST